MEQGNTPIYKHIKLLSHYSNISNNEFDIPSIIFERFAYLKWTPKAYMLKIYHKNNQEIFIALCSQEKIIFSNPVNKIYTEMCCIHRLNKTIHSYIHTNDRKNSV